MRIHALAAAALAALAAAPAAAGSISTDGQLVSTAATGTAPLAVSSTTLVDNLNAELLGGLPASAFAGRVGNVVHVGTTGGDFTSIQAALDSITDAGLDNWYTVLVGPGIFEESVTLKNFVTVRGQGYPDTRILATASGNVTAVVGAPFAVLRDVWVLAESTGGHAVALEGPLLLGERLIAYATGGVAGQATGLRVTSTASVDLVDVEIWAQSAATNTALEMESGADVSVRRGHLRGQGGTGTNYGIRRSFVASGGTLDLDDTTIAAVSASVGFAIRSEEGNLFISGCEVSASGSTQAVGIYNGDTIAVQLTGTTVHAFGDAPPNATIGIHQALGGARMQGGSIDADTAVLAAADTEVRAAYARVDGVLSGAGSYSCIGLYDVNTAPVVCP